MITHRPRQQPENFHCIPSWLPHLLVSGGLDVGLDVGELGLHVHGVPAQPLQRPRRLLQLAAVHQVARRLGRVLSTYFRSDIFARAQIFLCPPDLDGDEEEERRGAAHEGELAPVEPGAEQVGGEEARVGEDLEAGGQPASEVRARNLADVHLRILINQ